MQRASRPPRGVTLRARKTKTKTAECNLCNASVSRTGSSAGHFIAANLIRHLPKHHRKEYEDFLRSTSAGEARETPFSDKAKVITEKFSEFPWSKMWVMDVWLNILSPFYQLPKSAFHFWNGCSIKVQRSVRVHFEMFGKHWNGYNWHLNN